MLNTEVPLIGMTGSPMPKDRGGGDAEPSASQLLAFSPGKEQAAGVWETCLAPGWPQLRSCLPFGPRSQASLQKAQGPGVKEVMEL